VVGTFDPMGQTPPLVWQMFQVLLSIFVKASLIFNSEDYNIAKKNPEKYQGGKPCP